VVALLLGLTGRQCSGKSEIAKILREFGFDVLEMGEVLKSQIGKEDPSIEEVSKFAIEVRKKMGRGAVAKLAIPILRRKLSSGGKVVISGVRSPEEVEIFRKEFKEFLLIRVKSEKGNRIERALKRGRPDDPSSMEEFIEKEKLEEELGIEETMAMAEFEILNEGTLEELRRKTLELLDKLEGLDENRSTS